VETSYCCCLTHHHPPFPTHTHSHHTSTHQHACVPFHIVSPFFSFSCLAFNADTWTATGRLTHRHTHTRTNKLVAHLLVLSLYLISREGLAFPPPPPPHKYRSARVCPFSHCVSLFLFLLPCFQCRHLDSDRQTDAPTHTHAHK